VSPSDPELIARVLVEQDHEAFGELVLRYQSPLRLWLRRLTKGDASLADDLSQEAFVRAYRSLSSYRASGSFQSWLFRIAYRQYLNEIRRRSEPVGREADVADSESGTVLPPDGRSMDLEAAMKQVTHEQRAALTLCYQNGLTHEEAAAVLGCPVGTVKTNILRGKETLRCLLMHLVLL
jgi:RNA polymerase sigma factor (sigma-70 family)